MKSGAAPAAAIACATIRALAAAKAFLRQRIGYSGRGLRPQRLRGGHGPSRAGRLCTASPYSTRRCFSTTVLLGSHHPQLLRGQWQNRATNVEGRGKNLPVEFHSYNEAWLVDLSSPAGHNVR